MWLSVKNSLPVQCQSLHEEGWLCRREREGLRGESPPLEAGIPALALEATELCALGTPSTPPPHTHTQLLTPAPILGLRVIVPLPPLQGSQEVQAPRREGSWPSSREM